MTAISHNSQPDTANDESDLPHRLARLLAQYDETLESVDEHAVYRFLKSLSEEKSGANTQYDAEVMAFEFHEVYGDQANPWNMRFAPMMALNLESGAVLEVPSLSNVTVEWLEYWCDRARGAKHPVLRTRYAALAWETARVTKLIKPDHNMARTAIDGIIELCEKDLHPGHFYVADKLAGLFPYLCRSVILSARRNSAV